MNAYKITKLLIIGLGTIIQLGWARESAQAILCKGA
jgi:hypothetical protein